MPNRRLPDQFLAYLGPYREAETDVEKVVEQCGLGKFMNNGGLTDNDPLIVVMELVAEEVEGLRLSVNGRRGGKVWLEALQSLQADDSYTEHNTRIPCRSCNQAFEPVVDAVLRQAFVRWRRSRALADFLALHRCPKCGGKIGSKDMREYHGDFHTPEPSLKLDDWQWVEQLLEHHVGLFCEIEEGSDEIQS